MSTLKRLVWRPPLRPALPFLNPLLFPLSPFLFCFLPGRWAGLSMLPQCPASWPCLLNMVSLPLRLFLELPQERLLFSRIWDVLDSRKGQDKICCPVPGKSPSPSSQLTQAPGAQSWHLVTRTHGDPVTTCELACLLLGQGSQGRADWEGRYCPRAWQCWVTQGLAEVLLNK